MKKLFRLILVLLFISGCDIKYQLEIKGNNVIVKQYIWYDDSIEENPYDYTRNLLLENNENGDFLFPYGYTYKNLKSGDKKGLELTTKYKVDDYIDNGIYYMSCFENHNIDKDKEYITLNLSGKFKCYQYLNDLDTLNLSVKTNHKVNESNAEDTNNNTYSWKITKENADNTNIHLKLYSDKYVYNYDNVIFKRLGIVFLIICVTIVIGLFIKRKIRNYQINSNKL